MSLSFDKKEDLRLRMMELEKKLLESEEERSKLEKTCNILMSAFREEEKMHYKALNKKYEKFLEDCTLRRRRNDVILKSLCIIEDRARALFAKTERLKVLKDRYISSLKISDIKKDEPHLAVKNISYLSAPQKIIDDVTPKFVHWEFPYTSDIGLGHKMKEITEPESSLCKYDLTGGSLPKENKENMYEDVFTPRRILECKKQKEDVVKYSESWQSTFSEDYANAVDKQENSKETLYNSKPQKSHPYPENTNLNSDNKCGNITYTQPAVKSAHLEKDLVYPVLKDREMSYSMVLNNKPEDKNNDEVAAIREKVTVTHQESIEKLKKALSVENDEIENDKLKNSGEGQKIIEKDEIEMNEKNQFSKDNSILVNEDQVVTTKTHASPHNELINYEIDLQTDYIEENIEDKVSKNLPVGLDGVDYQNETYPESYYEQPVHHNHTSIASDVILEEDESEQDVDQKISEKEGKNSSGSEKESSFSENTNRKTCQFSDPHPAKQFVGSPNKANNKYDELYKFGSRNETFKTDATCFDKDEQSSKSESIQKSQKSNKPAPQSNLMHLLESDSESFQIEHGGLATGNEDSDFDFSFN